MREYDISIVCCYNDQKQYEELQLNINSQSIESKIIGIDNRNKNYLSCSSAFNAVIDSIDTEFVIFVHQDIRLLKRDSLKEIADVLCKINQGDILGVAGIGGKVGKALFTNIVNSLDELEVLTSSRYLIECDSVDECIFAGFTEWFVNNRFDEMICDDWHLYAVDRCLWTKTQRNRVYCLDIPLLHISRGKVNHQFNKCFYKLSKKYANVLKTVYAPCLVGNTDFFGRCYTYIRSELKVILNKY